MENTEKDKGLAYTEKVGRNIC